MALNIKTALPFIPIPPTTLVPIMCLYFAPGHSYALDPQTGFFVLDPEGNGLVPCLVTDENFSLTRV